MELGRSERDHSCVQSGPVRQVCYFHSRSFFFSLFFFSFSFFCFLFSYAQCVVCEHFCGALCALFTLLCLHMISYFLSSFSLAYFFSNAFPKLAAGRSFVWVEGFMCAMCCVCTFFWCLFLLPSYVACT